MWGKVLTTIFPRPAFNVVFGGLPVRHPNRNASLAEAFLFRGRVGVLMRVLWFDKLFLWKRLDAKPQGGAPP